MISKRGEGEGINWEMGIDIYTLLRLKEITSKELRHSTGNPAQYSVVTHLGKECKE